MGGLHGHRIVYSDGRAVCGRVGLPQTGVEGLRQPENGIGRAKVEAA